MPNSLPNITLNIAGAASVSALSAHRTLLVGQMLAGTATAGDLVSNMPSNGEEDAYFGITSHMAGMVRAYKALNEYSVVDVLPIADASGTAGTGVITLTGTAATAAGSLTLSFGSEKDYSVTLAVAIDDTPTNLGDAATTAFGLLTNAPFVVSNIAGAITATCEHDGTLCNEWGVSLTGSAVGITTATTAWTGGATDPTLTSILDAIGDTRYNTIVWPSGWDLAVVETLLDARFNVANDVRDGVVIQVKTDTLSSLETYADQNSQSVVIVGQKKVVGTLYKGPQNLEMQDVTAAQIAAIRSLRMTPDAPLTQFLTTVAANDQFGGEALASLPYFNTVMPNMPIGLAAHEFTSVEYAEMPDNGLTAVGNNKAASGVIFGEFVTTYLTDGAGNPDTDFKYLNTVDTLSVIREFYFNNLKSRFAQSRLTDGDILVGRDMVNEATIRAFCVELYIILSGNALTQAGQTALKDYKDNLSVVVDVAAGTATINQAPLLVSQLRGIVGTINLNLGA